MSFSAKLKTKLTPSLFAEMDFFYEKVLFVLFAIICGGFFIFDTSLHRLFMYLALPICLGHLIHQKVWSQITLKYLFWAMFTYLGFSVLSLAWSADLDAERIFQKSKLLVFIPIFTLSFGLMCKKYDSCFKHFMSFMCAVASVSALFILFQYVREYADTEKLSRMVGFNRTSNEVQLGMYFSIATLAALLLPKDIMLFRDKVWVKYSFVFLFVLTVFLSGSRGPLLALSATIFLLMLLKKRFKTMFTVLMCVTVLGTTIWLSSSDTLSMQNRLDNGRLQIWTQAIQEVKEKPFLGYGVGTKLRYHVETKRKFYNTLLKWEVGHPHNLYLSTLVAVGFLGYIFFLLLAMTAAIQGAFHAVVRAKFIPLAFLLFGGLVGFTDMGGYIINLSIEWLFFWIPIGLYIFTKPLSFTDFKKAYVKQ